MKLVKKAFLSSLLVLLLFAVSVTSAHALTFDGTTSNGTTINTSSASGKYAIDITKTGSNTTVVGLRFSVWNTQSNSTVSSVIDVFRKGYDSAGTVAARQKTIVKHNHKDLALNWQDYTLVTAESMDNVFIDVDNLGIYLPTTTGEISDWQEDSYNLDQVLSACNIGSIESLKYGDRILIEPIFPIKIEGIGQVLTVGEIAVYGANMFGADTAISANNNQGSWGYIADFTNKHYPNSIYTADGSGVFSATSELSSRATFGTILAYGYGTSICYTDVCRTPSNGIAHWAWGFNNSEGNNGAKNAFHLGSTWFSASVGSTVTIGFDRAVSIPNGFYLDSNYYTAAWSGTWSSYAIGSSVVQPDKEAYIEYHYYPTTYNISYNLNGGTNNADNPDSYNVLYGVALKEPTKEGHSFEDWYAETEIDNLVMPASSHDYNFRSLLANVQPNTTYNISMGSAVVNAGTATKFATLIYDFTDAKVLAEQRSVSFGENIKYSLTCPETAEPSHDIRLIVYAGVNGSTSGNEVTYKDVEIGYNLGFKDVSYLDLSNASFKANTEINGTDGSCMTGPNYASTENLIPVKGGSALISNMSVCGVYSYDKDGNFIKRESNYTNVHPISPNAAYIRVELYTAGSVSFDTYKSNLTICTAKGINAGEKASFSNADDLYNQLDSRTTGDFTLTAQWKENTFTVTYDANGGKNVPENQAKIPDVDLTLSSEKPSNKGYYFKSWSTSSDGAGDTYHPGDAYTINEDLTLYAQWGRYRSGYVDGKVGNDSNTGLTPDDSVKTFRQAYINLKDIGGTIYVVDTVSISNTIKLTNTYYQDENGRVDIADGKTITIKRYSKPTTVNEGFDVASNTNALIQIQTTGNMTLENIVVDGHRNSATEGSVNEIATGVTTSTGSLVFVSEGKLNLNKDAILQNNIAKEGGAVLVYRNGTLNTNGATLQNNQVTDSGGGIYLSGAASFVNTTFSNNVADNTSESADGGAIYSLSDYVIKITNCTFDKNKADDQGGAVYFKDDAEITGGVFSNNRGKTGAGIFCQSSLTIKDAEITNNTAWGYSVSQGGGGIWCGGTTGSVLNVDNCTITGNTAQSGGGIQVICEANIKNSTISNNTGHSEGGGITSSFKATIENCTIDNNTSWEGGGVYHKATTDSKKLVVKNSSITNNNADRYGGGICTKLSQAIVELTDVTISDNTARYGGGIHSVGFVTLYSGEITKNDGDFYGGGVSNNGTFTTVGGTISENTSPQGQGVYQNGTFKMSADGCVNINNDVYLVTDKVITVNGKLSYTGIGALITPAEYTLGRICVVVEYNLDNGNQALASNVYKQFQLNPKSGTLEDTEGDIFRPGTSVDEIDDTHVIISRIYNINYDANGGSGAPSSQIKYWNEKLTLRSQKPIHSIHSFVTWNTKIDETGTNYNPGVSYTVNESVTLYAVWDRIQADGVGHKTIRVGDVVDPSQYLDRFTFPEGKIVDSFVVSYNGVPRDDENKATTVGAGYTIVYDIIFTDGTAGEYRLIVSVVDGELGPIGYIRFISRPYLNTLETNSKWRIDNLNLRLTNTLSIEMPNDTNAQEVWRFSPQDIQDIKDWVKECDSQGKSRQQQNELFGSMFGKCQIKGKYADSE